MVLRMAMTMKTQEAPGFIKLIWILGVFLISAGSVLGTSLADEIRFKDAGAMQAGTVLEEDDRAVTIRFPRESITSIVRKQGNHSGPEKPGFAASPESPGNSRNLEERVKELERKLDLLDDSVKHSGNAISKKELLSEQLVEAETGGVEGVIRWKGKPLAHSDVMVVMMRYTGISLASLRKMRTGSGDTDQEFTFRTTTDAFGRYRFGKVPPGEYLLYWRPDAETGWVRRMNDKSDFEVLPGKMTVLNIPAERK